METSQLQKKSVEFIHEFNRSAGRKPSDATSLMIHLTEEVGEIAAEIFNDVSGRANMNKEHLGHEIADVFMAIALMAEMHGLDVEKLVVGKMEKDSKRMK